MSDKPKLRWYQCSLRTLLMATLLLGCALTPIVHFRQKTHRENLARYAVERLGGTVYSYYVPARIRPQWMKAVLGDDSCGGHIDIVDFRYREITNADLRHVEAFAELTALRLDNALVDDAGLKDLRKLRHLKYLTVSDTFITKAALRDLQLSLPDLTISIVPSEASAQPTP